MHLRYYRLNYFALLVPYNTPGIRFWALGYSSQHCMFKGVQDGKAARRATQLLVLLKAPKRYTHTDEYHFEVPKILCSIATFCFSCNTDKHQEMLSC